MKLDKTYIGLIAFLLVALIAMFGAYRFVTNHQNNGPSIGVVRLNDVLEMNPSYEDYKLAKD